MRLCLFIKAAISIKNRQDRKGGVAGPLSRLHCTPTLVRNSCKVGWPGQASNSEAHTVLGQDTPAGVPFSFNSCT